MVAARSFWLAAAAGSQGHLMLLGISWHGSQALPSNVGRARSMLPRLWQNSRLLAKSAGVAGSPKI